ncbi:MAG TPA: ABC transporter substrate-binding protein [Clostridiales bacterium]|nr:ABC transporter substrate-binding protein [Clostridiales bacterium]
MKTFKKIAAIIMSVVLLLSFASCSKEDSNSNQEKTLKIGVIQFAPHPSLDNCYNGLIQGLKEAGFEDGKNIKIDFQNAQGEDSNSDLYAKTMVTSKYDMIIGIATPAALSAYSAAKDAGIPVVFSAVSDPVRPGLVKTIEKPLNNCTGTSDVLPLEKQIQMIREFLPNAKKIGILYTTSEPNSLTHLAAFRDLAPKYGFEIEALGVTNASEVASAAVTLTSKGVDCINNFTDNNVVNNLPSVINAANQAKIPVFGSEVEQVKNGCIAAESIDYVSLGVETGKMAAQILKGEVKAGELAVKLISDSKPVYNKQVMDSLGITLPEKYKDAEQVESNR